MADERVRPADDQEQIGRTIDENATGAAADEDFEDTDDLDDDEEDEGEAEATE